MISVHYTMFSRAFGAVHAYISQTEVCASQIEIIMYTSQCKSANMAQCVIF